MIRRIATLGLLISTLSLVCVGLASAAPTWPILFESARFDSLALPTFVAGDGSGVRLYIAEQGGRIYVTPPDSQSYTLFLDLSGKVSTGGERGLLGLAFSPDFASSREFYVNYTDASGDTVIARYEASPGDPDVALPGSEEIVLTYDQPYTNHNGGWLGFGPDGYLYISSGDGGGGGDPQGNAQNRANLLGKMIRIDVVGEATYSVPASNPFVGTAGVRTEIWSYGLRNPWRCSFDTAGNLWIGDVGQNAWEELDFQPAASAGGENWGWDRWEGNHPYPVGSTPPSTAGYTFPAWEYRTDIDGEAIIGGYEYRGTASPGMQGFYYCADFLYGRVWAVHRSGSTFSVEEVLKRDWVLSSFGEADDGSLFLCSRSDGVVYELLDAEEYSDRLWAPDRYSTAIKIAREAFDPAGDSSWPGVTHTVIASGEDRAAADPLSSAGLCWAYDAPLMLTHSTFTPHDVNKAVAEIVDANGEVTLHVVGGTVSIPWPRVQAIRAFVRDELGMTDAEAAARVKYDRLTPNGDRYTVATTIADRMESVAASDPGKTMLDAVLVANGADSSKFFDPLALSPIAASKGAPILLVAKDSVPGATASYLQSRSPADVIVGGGPATVSGATYASVGATDRWFGSDRYSTATDIASNAVIEGWLAAEVVGVAAKLPDAMTGGSALGNRRSGVLLVTQGTHLSSAPRSWLSSHSAETSQCYVLGGPVSVDDEVRRDVARVLE